MDAVAQAMGAWSAGSGFSAIRERTIQFAKDNAEAGFTLAGELAKAKNMQELLTLQSRYTQTQIQAYALQAQELGRIMTEAVRNMQSKAAPRPEPKKAEKKPAEAKAKKAAKAEKTTKAKAAAKTAPAKAAKGGAGQSGQEAGRRGKGVQTEKDLYTKSH
jgi:Phasin protein